MTIAEYVRAALVASRPVREAGTAMVDAERSGNVDRYALGNQLLSAVAEVRGWLDEHPAPFVEPELLWRSQMDAWDGLGAVLCSDRPLSDVEPYLEAIATRDAQFQKLAEQTR